jgi:hypothetical protein
MRASKGDCSKCARGDFEATTRSSPKFEQEAPNILTSAPLGRRLPDGAQAGWNASWMTRKKKSPVTCL